MLKPNRMSHLHVHVMKCSSLGQTPADTQQNHFCNDAWLPDASLSPSIEVWIHARRPAEHSSASKSPRIRFPKRDFMGLSPPLLADDDEQHFEGR